MRNPMLLLLLVGLLLLRFATRQLLALFAEYAKRPKRILSVRHELLANRCDASATQQFVQLLFRAALPVGRDLDEFKWHRSDMLFLEKIREQGLRPYNPF